jgi:hypothetical protein
LQRLAGIAALLLLPGLAAADEFFARRDENPLVRGYYTPLPADERANATQSFAATLSVSNTTNVDADATEQYLIDGEALTLRLRFEDALGESLHYRLSVPLIHDSGGFLDPFIEDWHRWFGFNRGYRPYYPNNQIVYSYSGLTRIELDRPQTSIGDIAADLGYFLQDDAASTVSVWGGLKAPTGSVRRLSGDGAWDGAFFVHYARRFARWQLGAELGLAEPFGDELFAGHGHTPSGFGRLALTRSLGVNWGLRAQLDGQTRRIADSHLRLTGPDLELSVGATRRLFRRWHVEFGFAEDAAVNTAPDITFFVGIRN